MARGARTSHRGGQRPAARHRCRQVPANYVVRRRREQAGLRKSALRMYHIQRVEFLPSAYAMIVSFVIMILLLLMFTTSAFHDIDS